ncbi:MAG: hypothetical protein LIP08_12830 [Bacteroides sp.]|nr:hypothetical protein [Bacteroides sp.]
MVRSAVFGFDYNPRATLEMSQATKALFYPSLTLGTGSSLACQSTTLSDFFKPEHLVANLVGGLIQPLYSTGDN